MKLAYKAVDKSGNLTVDSIDATSREEASDRLRQRGLFVTEIGEATAAGRDGEHGPSRRQGRFVKELTLWSRQMCVLVRSGTPLAQALHAIERQSNAGPWQEILESIRHDVEEGSSLSDAMTRRPEIFDPVTRSLVAAGESSGQLGPMLDRVARLQRQQLKTRRALTSALVYPVLLGMVGLTVTLVMLLGVLPRFSELFESLEAALPPSTEALLILSAFVRQWWWAILLGMAAVGAGVKLYFSGEGGRRTSDQLAVRLPYVGTMVKSLATARIARLLGVMLESHVPLLEAMELTRHSTGNVLYEELMTRAVRAAESGEAVSAAFSRSPLISPSVAEAIRHGERNGQIGPILTDMADFLDEENEVVVRTTMSILEPLILIVLGLVVGFIALSLFLPLFDLTAATGVK